MTTFGGLRSMWILVMFDLPTSTKEFRKSYSDFRKFLMKDGFLSLQYSIYTRHCFSSEKVKIHENRVRKALPNTGEVRLLTFTDKQFSRMEVFHGNKKTKLEKSPDQLMLF